MENLGVQSAIDTYSMMPYSKINIGDIFQSPCCKTTYTVVNKDDAEKMIELYPSYQHLALPRTIWKKNTDKIFTTRKLN